MGRCGCLRLTANCSHTPKWHKGCFNNSLLFYPISLCMNVPIKPDAHFQTFCFVVVMYCFDLTTRKIQGHKLNYSSFFISTGERERLSTGYMIYTINKGLQIRPQKLPAYKNVLLACFPTRIGLNHFFFTHQQSQQGKKQN